MANYTLGKRTEVPISIVGKQGKHGNRSSGWWQSMRPCPICKAVEGKRMYLMTDGNKFFCNHCEDRGRVLPEKELGPQGHMKKKELKR